MGLLNWIFGKSNSVVYVNNSTPVSKYAGDAYEHRVVRSIVDCIASHCAKADAMHVMVDEKDNIKKIIHNSPYTKLLNQKSNAWMSGYDVKYKIISALESDTTSLIYVKWKDTNPELFLPVQYSNAKIYPVGQSFAVEFYDNTGNKYILPIEDLIIIRKFYHKSELWGDGNGPVYQVLDLIKSADTNFSDAMNISNKMRGILKQKKGVLDPSDIDEEANKFAERYTKAAAKGGVVGIDITSDYIPIDLKTNTANFLQMKEIREELYRYWHVSEAILTSSYTPSQWQAFYESVLEPRLVSMGQAFTNVCFTDREKDVGNRLIFNTSLLLHTSVDTKINIMRETKEQGLLTINEQRGLLGFPPIEGGDVRPSSLNYVDSDIKEEYQTGKVTGEGGNDEQE